MQYTLNETFFQKCLENVIDIIRLLTGMTYLHCLPTRYDFLILTFKAVNGLILDYLL